jgi:RNA polymerase sigma factor (sigma-70 family)
MIEMNETLGEGIVEQKQSGEYMHEALCTETASASPVKVSDGIIAEASVTAQNERLIVAELVLRIHKDRDLAAFNRLYMRYNATLFNYALVRASGRHQLAEDVFQEAFEKVINLIITGEGKLLQSAREGTIEFSAYVKKIIDSKLASHFRARINSEVPFGDLDPDILMREASVSHQNENSEEETLACQLNRPIVDPGTRGVRAVNQMVNAFAEKIEDADPLKQIEKEEQQAVLRRAITQLPQAQRNTLLLWMSGLSYEQIAEMEGMKPEGIRTRLKKAMQRTTDTFQAIYA